VKNYLTTLGVDIWYSVVNGYVIQNNAPIDPNEKKLMSCNSKARHVILVALAPTIASKVMGCNTAKEVWDKLKNIYKGDPKVKQFNDPGGYRWPPTFSNWPKTCFWQFW
jgi:hypothetical protein